MEFFPILLFILACVYLKQKFQLLIAFVISSVYCLVMMAVLIGIIVQMLEDGPLAPASLFFLLVAVQITIAGEALTHLKYEIRSQVKALIIC